MLKAMHDKIRELTIQKLNAIPFGCRMLTLKMGGLKDIWDEAEKEINVYTPKDERNDFCTTNMMLLTYNYYLSPQHNTFEEFCLEEWRGSLN